VDFDVASRNPLYPRAGLLNLKITSIFILSM